MTLISIGIITFNHENFILQCLESIKAQTYKNFELIISNDASKDNTDQKIQEFIKQNPNLNIQYFNQAYQLGITKNCNFVLSKTNGKYFALMAGDDIMMPERIEKQFDALENYPEASFCYSNCEWFSSKSGKKLFNHFGWFQKRPDTLIDLISDNTIPTPTMMIRKSMIPQYGFDERLDYISDFKMAIDLWLNGKPVYLSDCLIRYRKHSLSITTNNNFIDDRKTLLDIFVKEFSNVSGISKAIKNYSMITKFAHTKELINNKNYRDALIEFLKIIPYSFSSIKWFLRITMLINSFFVSFLTKR